MEILEGRVQKIKGGYSYVSITKSAECEGCKACNFGRDNTMSLPAVDELGCAIGDKVLVQMPEKRIIGASVYMYGIPLLLMLIAAFIGNIFSQTVAIISAFAALFVSVAVVWFIDKRYRRKKDFMPLIIKIINDNEGEKQ